MIFTSGKRTKIVVAGSAAEFEAKLNKELEELERKRTKYELQFNHSMGFCAYIVAEYSREIPENVAEEFKIAGESHTCIECPYWVHPTKGNVKYTRCPITAGIHGAKSPCCDKFYDMLFNGEIELEEVDDNA